MDEIQEALNDDENRARVELLDDLAVVLRKLQHRRGSDGKVVRPDPAVVRTILAGPLGVVLRTTAGRVDDLRDRRVAELDAKGGE